MHPKWFCGAALAAALATGLAAEPAPASAFAGAPVCARGHAVPSALDAAFAMSMLPLVKAGGLMGARRLPRVAYLIVGAGGGGAFGDGTNQGGHGGGGEVLEGEFQPIFGDSFAVTVGTSGFGGQNPGSAGQPGGDTTLAGIGTADGGEGGQFGDGNGGTGGDSGNGNAGGSTGDVNGGGGGGAGGAASGATPGAGVTSDFTGSSVEYGRGGENGVAANNPGQGASGGFSTANNGAAGRVLLRYRGPQRFTGGTVSTVGDYTLHTFTGNGTFAVSGAPSAVPAITGVPVVSGVEAVGETLTTTDGAWTNSPTGYAYQWQQSDDGLTGWSNISGATSQTYVVGAGLLGKYIRSTVLASNAIGSAASAAASAATGQIGPAVTGHHPSVVDSSWGEHFWRDFEANPVISLGKATTDAENDTDKGEFQAGTARYRAPNFGLNATYTEFGIPGFGYDVFTDPLGPAVPPEYVIDRPLGEIEPLAAGGIRLHARTSPNAATTAALNSQFGDVNGAAAAGAALHTSALLTTYRRLAAEPPFARYVKFIPRFDGGDKSFLAAMWSTEDDNRAYSEIGGVDQNTDEVESPFEYDDQEFLGFGAGGRAHSVSIHASGFDGGVGDGNPIDLGECIDQVVEVVTVFESDQVTTYMRLNETGSWTSKSTAVSAMGGSNYQQKHTGFIHNIAWGFPWEGATGKPSGDQYVDILAAGFWAPASNATVVAPSAAPPDEVTISGYRNSYDSAGLDEDLAVGTVVADLTVPAEVTSINVITYNGRLTAYVTGSGVGELRVGAALDFETQPVLRFALEGVTAGGERSVGRLYSLTVNDVAEADWWNANALLHVQEPNNRAFIGGTGVVAVTAVHSTSNGAMTAAADAAMETAAYVLVLRGSGGADQVKGLLGNGTDFFLWQWQAQLTPDQQSIRPPGAADTFGDIGLSTISDEWIGVFSCGVGGTKAAIAAPGTVSADIAFHATRPTQTFSGGFFWNTGFGDRFYNGSRLELLVIAPENIGGSAGAVLTDAQLRSIIENGI